MELITLALQIEVYPLNEIQVIGNFDGWHSPFRDYLMYLMVVLVIHFVKIEKYVFHANALCNAPNLLKYISVYILGYFLCVSGFEVIDLGIYVYEFLFWICKNLQINENAADQ